VDRILALFDQHDTKATFFTLGWIAERYPTMIQRIVAAGHELASHGWEHIRVTQQTPDQFREDILKTKGTLEALSGQQIRGYRAASYSIVQDNADWAWDTLADTGHEYSSSIVPIKHDLYGIPQAPRFKMRVAQNRLLEIPITTVTLAGKNINCGGGGWFRLFPYRFSRWALNQVNVEEAEPGIFYFHPWEIDADQPRVENLPAKTRLRHYINLNRTYRRLSQLLGDFSWDRMDNIFLQQERC
jgi:polysaccharide deacetylase family protein (PEP-CTERM system associated)